MPSIELQRISNSFCRDINFSVDNRDLLVLLGPVGAGKTTILNIIAGLIGYEGSVKFDGRPVDKIPPCRRKVGYLFQDILLFPHLTVEENIAYGLSIRKVSPSPRKRRTREIVSLLGLESLTSRYPRNLSGGEKQRVALARALAISPDVMLLDEPLRSLDSEMTNHLQIELRRLQRELHITTIYVTHNLEEAYAMGERIAILIDGRLVQVGSKKEIFERPASVEIAKYLNYRNIFRGKAETQNTGSRIDFGHFGIALKEKLPAGKETAICIRPQDLKVIREGVPIRGSLAANVFSGKIVSLLMLPQYSVMRFKIEGSPLPYDFELKFPAYIKDRHGLAAGKPVRVAVWEPSIIVF